MNKKNKPKDSASSIQSMTGYGKGSVAGSVATIEVELKSVNSRFLDVICKLPRVYQEWESDIRAGVAGRVQRGRVEVTVSRQAKSILANSINFNRPVFEAYWQTYQNVHKEFAGKMDEAAVVRELLSRKEVLDLAQGEEVSANERDQIAQALDAALDGLSLMRQNEGRTLELDIRARFEALSQLINKIGELGKANPAMFRDRILQRVQKLAPEVTVDESRLAAEVAFLADRVEITEEIVRFNSHLQQAQTALANPPCGRKLDFLLQELGREVNTITSKAQDVSIQQLTVEAKTELEKIREQVQNLE